MSYLTILKLAAPEAVLVIAVLAVLAMDLLWLRSRPLPVRLRAGAAVAGAGCLAALIWIGWGMDEGRMLNGMLVIDPLTRWVKGGVLVLTLFTLWISTGARFTEHVGEYFAMVLLATTGMLFLVGTEDILMIFVSLELTSLSLYILTAFNKQALSSSEAALKYFLFGGLSAAFTLFGLSLIYGMSGSTQLREIASALSGEGMSGLLLVGLLMTVAGLGFKIAAAPFHLWAPDAYQGAPTPAAALIASGSKLASFFILAKVMWLGFAGMEGSGGWGRGAVGWIPVLAILATVSMVLGNLAAVAQSRIKRLLAYSAIAHAGYILLGVVAPSSEHGMAAVLYYSVTYGLATIGAFGVVSLVEADAGEDRITCMAGLGRRSPLMGFCLMIFMLSLAGIPPLAGFFGKFYLFSAAAGAGLESGRLELLWLVILAIGMSVISLYYYLQVLKQVYVVTDSDETPRLASARLTQTGIAVLAAGVILLGCMPDWLLGGLTVALQHVTF